MLWPVADALRFHGGRVALFTGLLCLSLGAWTAAMLNGHAPGPLARSATDSISKSETLKGVQPTFPAAHTAAKPKATGAGKAGKPVSSAPPGLHTPGTVARTFTNAFLGYEVGQGTHGTARIFARTATPSVAKSLRTRPPRLPGKSKVPRGKIRNVIVRRSGKAIEASIAIVRRGALGELRLTLRKTSTGWRVSQVRA